MPNQVSAIAIAEPEHAPGRFVLFRAEFPHLNFDFDHTYVWCGRSMGWLPVATTSNVFFRLFASEDEARKAADKYITLPVQEEDHAF